MHNKVKEAITNCLTEYEVQVKAKIPMDADFLAMLLTVKVVEELQTKEVAAPKPTKKPKEDVKIDGQEKSNALRSLGLVEGSNKA